MKDLDLKTHAKKLKKLRRKQTKYKVKLEGIKQKIAQMEQIAKMALAGPASSDSDESDSSSSSKEEEEEEEEFDR